MQLVKSSKEIEIAKEEGVKRHDVKLKKRSKQNQMAVVGLQLHVNDASPSSLTRTSDILSPSSSEVNDALNMPWEKL